MSTRLFVAVLAVLTALTLAVGAYAGAARGNGSGPDRVVAAVPPPDGPSGTCVICV